MVLCLVVPRSPTTLQVQPGVPVTNPVCLKIPQASRFTSLKCVRKDNALSPFCTHSLENCWKILFHWLLLTRYLRSLLRCSFGFCSIPNFLLTILNPCNLFYPILTILSLPFSRTDSWSNLIKRKYSILSKPPYFKNRIFFSSFVINHLNKFNLFELSLFF